MRSEARVRAATTSAVGAVDSTTIVSFDDISSFIHIFVDHDAFVGFV